MELFVRHFTELTTEQLYNILSLRIAVFVVEQNCPYQELDEADKSAYHLWLEDENGIQAYLRLLPKREGFDEISLGRVIALKRRCGLGSRILNEGLRAAKEILKAESIVIEAQSYAREFYEKSGFVRISDEFLLDGIAHIKMKLTFS